MPPSDFITKQVDQAISSNSPSTLMGARSVLRFNRIPTWLAYLVIMGIVASWIPIAAAVRAKFVKSSQPPVHLWLDLDVQAKYTPQAVSAVFADNMAMRLAPAGTVARGRLDEDDFFHRGFVLNGNGEPEWFDGFPDGVRVDAESLARGKEFYARYCAMCHGFDGYGNGMIHVRTIANIGQSPNWVQPSSLHDDVRRERENGHIYNTINNGIRSMAGYGTQIGPEDRWAIVAYVRALQLSQHADPSLVPENVRGTMDVHPPSIGGRAFVLPPTEDGSLETAPTSDQPLGD